MGVTARPEGVRSLPPVVLPALLALFGALSARAVATWVMQDFPSSADEAVYLWQAQAFAEGRVTAEIPQPRDTFALFHLGDVAGVRFSRFPPGWPMLLALGVALDAPGWVNPVLAGLTLSGLFLLARAHIGSRAALLGVGVVGLSPFFLVNGGSFHSHPASLFALTGLALCLERGLSLGPGGAPGLCLQTEATASGGTRDPIGQGLLFGMAGLFFGLAVTVRSFTGLLLGLPLVLVAFLRSVSTASRACVLVRIGSFILGGLPFLAFLLYVNHAVSGDPFRLPTTILDPEEGIGLGVHGHTLIQGLQNTLVWGIEGLAWTFFMSPFLLLLGRGKAGQSERLWWVLLLALPLGYLFYWNPGGNRYGPRFWFEALLPFTLLAGAGLQQALSVRRYRVLLGVLGLLGLLVLGQHLKNVAGQIQARSAASRAVEQAGLQQAVVLLLGSVGDMPVYDLTRNPPDFRSAPVLYGRGRGEGDREVLAAFPERSFYYYRWNQDGGVLTPLDPGHLELPDAIPGLSEALGKQRN